MPMANGTKLVLGDGVWLCDELNLQHIWCRVMVHGCVMS